MNFSFVSCIVIGYLFSLTDSYPVDQKDKLIAPNFKLVTTTNKKTIYILHMHTLYKENSVTLGSVHN